MQVTKIEEQAISCLTLEQENQEVKLQLANKLETETRTTLELQKAKTIIERQQKELAVKAQESEDLKFKLINSLITTKTQSSTKKKNPSKTVVH